MLNRGSNEGVCLGLMNIENKKRMEKAMRAIHENIFKI